MGANDWIIPVATLSSICGISLIFIWWWFPRTWIKGTQKEMELMALERAARERQMQQGNLESGETGEADPTAPKEPPKVFTYRPPAYATY